VGLRASMYQRLEKKNAVSAGDQLQQEQSRYKPRRRLGGEEV
jgi:hypothetical protein